MRATTSNPEHPMWRMVSEAERGWEAPHHGRPWPGGGRGVLLDQRVGHRRGGRRRRLLRPASELRPGGRTPRRSAWSGRIPLGEVARLLLMGLDERVSATTARGKIGLVSEVVPRDELWDHAHRLAAIVAANRPSPSNRRSGALGIPRPRSAGIVAPTPGVVPGWRLPRRPGDLRPSLSSLR